MKTLTILNVGVLCFDCKRSAHSGGKGCGLDSDCMFANGQMSNAKTVIFTLNVKVLRGECK